MISFKNLTLDFAGMKVSLASSLVGPPGSFEEARCSFLTHFFLRSKENGESEGIILMYSVQCSGSDPFMLFSIGNVLCKLQRIMGRACADRVASRSIFIMSR